MNSDSSAQTRLTNNQGKDDSPVWCPDGLRIAFVSNRDAIFDIYVMNADDSDQTNLTMNQASDTFVASSPIPVGG